jgi:two-component system response regulator NreC
LQLIANVTTSKKIAKLLLIDKVTSETHRKNMICKLDLETSSELVKYAIDKKYKF